MSQVTERKGLWTWIRLCETMLAMNLAVMLPLVAVFHLMGMLDKGFFYGILLMTWFLAAISLAALAGSGVYTYMMLFLSFGAKRSEVLLGVEWYQILLILQVMIISAIAAANLGMPVSSILCLVGCSLLGASGLGMISMYIRLKAGMHYFAIVAPVLPVLSGLMAGFNYVETAVLSQDQAPELLAGFPLQKEMLMILFAAGLLLHIVGFIGFRCGMRKCAVEL